LRDDCVATLKDELRDLSATPNAAVLVAVPIDGGYGRSKGVARLEAGG
jgi:hypothetical protein